MDRVSSIIIALLLFCVIASAQSFTFQMPETTLTNTNGDSAYKFAAQVTNLLDVQQSLVYILEPQNFPEPDRWTSICTYQGCYPPRAGVNTVTQQYQADYIDTCVTFDIYNVVNGTTAPIVGDHFMRITLRSDPDTTEHVTYLLSLYDDQSVSVRPLPLAGDYRLLYNYPNPFNGETRISFYLPQPGEMEVSVYDLSGRFVDRIYSTPYQAAGRYELNWSAVTGAGIPLPSGSYFIRLTAGDTQAFHRLMLVR